MKKPENQAINGRLVFFEQVMVREDRISFADPLALLFTQEAPPRLRRGRFVFSSASENKFSSLLQKTKPAAIAAGFVFVGKTGFEPATPWSQTRCATGLRYFPGECLNKNVEE